MVPKQQYLQGWTQAHIWHEILRRPTYSLCMSMHTAPWHKTTFLKLVYPLHFLWLASPWNLPVYWTMKSQDKAVLFWNCSFLWFQDPHLGNTELAISHDLHMMTLIFWENAPSHVDDQSEDLISSICMEYGVSQKAFMKILGIALLISYHIANLLPHSTHIPKSECVKAGFEDMSFILLQFFYARV